MTPTSEAPAPAVVPSAPNAASTDNEALHALVMHQLDEDQAIEIVTIPLAGISTIADHMVIASGRSTRHVAAMAEKITGRIKRELRGSTRIEGLPTADWVLIDAGDVIVHLFRPEVRSFYNLERMWSSDRTATAADVRPIVTTPFADDDVDDLMADDRSDVEIEDEIGNNPDRDAGDDAPDAATQPPGSFSY